MKAKKIFAGVGYWLAQITWGAPMTLVGAVATAVCLAFCGGRAHRNGFSVIVEAGGDWGGLSLGAFALCGRYSQKDGPCYDLDWYEHTRRHEAGHGLQNVVFGPLMPFVVMLPSAIRYWYRRLTPGKRHGDYDSVWFEGQATRWGEKYISRAE